MLNKIILRCNSSIEEKIYLNEMQTKTSIILPFFQYLGYDTEDFFMFKAEYSCGRERVDYAILTDDNVDILIETKKISENLDLHFEQIDKYMKFHKSAIIGVLTNGVEYRFYTRNKKNLKEVWRLNILSLTDNDLDLLNKCKNGNLKILEMDTLVKPFIINTTIKKLLSEPNNDFLKIIKLMSGVNDIELSEVKLALDDLLNTKKEVVKQDTMIKEEYNPSIERSKRNLKNKGLSEDEISWLLRYKSENNFDLYKSIRVYLTKYPLSSGQIRLSNLVEDYLSCSDINRLQYVLNNKNIFLNVCKQLIPDITLNNYSYIDDVFNKNKLISNENINN